MRINFKSNIVLLLSITIVTIFLNSCKQDNYIDWKVMNEKWLEIHKSDPGFISTESGLCYKVIREGNPSDRKPNVGSYIVVTYEGKRIDGTVFDSGEEINLGTLSYMIPGWQEGLVKMNNDATYEFYIPWELGYGKTGSGTAIPPYSTLIFTVELVDSYN